MRISDWSSDVCSSDLESSLDQIEDRPRITHFGVGKRWPHPGAESVRFDLAQCHRHRSNVVEPSVIAIRIAERVIDVGGGIERSIPDRKSVVKGKSVSVRVDLGGRRIIKKKKKK